MTKSLTAKTASPTRFRLGFRLCTAFFSLWMLFTAYAQLAIPAAQAAFVHLGIPHLATGDGREKFMWAVVTMVILFGSYLFYRRQEPTALCEAGW